MTLLGPVAQDPSWQAKAGEGFNKAIFLPNSATEAMYGLAQEATGETFVKCLLLKSLAKEWHPLAFFAHAEGQAADKAAYS